MKHLSVAAKRALTRRAIAIGALLFMLTADALAATGPNARAPVVTRLPDWSGVWVLTDESWEEAQLAFTGRDKGAVPLNGKFMAMRAENLAAPGGLAENSVRCMPSGTPSSGSLPMGHEYLFTPGRVTMIFEDDEVRRIDTSGRGHPALADLMPTLAGHSIGHWEGSTLIVDTIGISPQAEFFIGLRVTATVHIHERISRKDKNNLVIDTVVEDPMMFIKPYSYTRVYKHSNDPPFEYLPCTDDNRDTTVEGRQFDVNLTPPAEKTP